MTVTTQFAPSPTGHLHVGNARTALVVWLAARASGGTMLLRLDDTDAARSTAAFAEAVQRDLAWFGLDWDRAVRQSDRLDRYAEAAARLRAAGALYACRATPEELSLERKALLAAGRPPILDRARLEGLGDPAGPAHWRLEIGDGAIAWDDLVRGHVAFAGADLSDPVLVREDGRPLYHLSTVVDDIELGVTHVIRGEDHVANTALHVRLFQALGHTPPRFAHLPLLVDGNGKPLSKRSGGLSVASLKEEGIEPLALASLLARIGTSDPVEAAAGLGELVAGFDFGKFGRAAPRFDREALDRLNARVLHDLPFDHAAGRLAQLGLKSFDEAFWQAVRPNLRRLEDALPWWDVIHGAIVPRIEDPRLAAQAARLLPSEPWDETTWRTWTDAVAASTGLRGRDLFHPLRLALTAREEGPEMKVLLPLIGRKRVLARLAGGRA